MFYVLLATVPVFIVLHRCLAIDSQWSVPAAGFAAMVYILGIGAIAAIKKK